jgi:hypothetical protein
MTSREPTSAAHRERLYAAPAPPKAEPAPAPTQLPKPQPPRRRAKPRVRVEGTARDRALTKALTTTEALSAEERRIVAGYRLSKGGPEAEAERKRIEQHIRKEKK